MSHSTRLSIGTVGRKREGKSVLFLVIQHSFLPPVKQVVSVSINTAMSNSRCFKVMKVITISCNLLAFTGSLCFVFVAVYDQLFLHLEGSTASSAHVPVKSIVNTTLIDRHDVILQQIPQYFLIIVALITTFIAAIGLLGFIQENVIIIFIYAILLTASWILRIAAMIKFAHYTLWTDIIPDVIFLIFEALLVFLSFRIAYELKRDDAINQPDSLDTLMDTRTSVKTVPLRLSTADVKDKETDVDDLDMSTSTVHNERTTSSGATNSTIPFVNQHTRHQQTRRSLTKASLNVKANFG